MQAVDALGVEDQVRKRQLEQRLDLRAGPVMACDAVEAAYGSIRAGVRKGTIIHGSEDGGRGGLKASAAQRAWSCGAAIHISHTVIAGLVPAISMRRARHFKARLEAVPR